MTAGSLPRIEWGSFEIGGPRHEYREGLLMELAGRYFPANAWVLDAGCGGGSLMFRMCARGYRVRGVEGSPRFVERVRGKIRKLGADDRVEIREGTLTALPYPDRSFDAVISGEVLEHVAEDDRAVREFHRVLKEGGVCIVSVPAHPALWDFTDEWAGHVRRYERGQLVDLFEKGGFRVERIRSWGFPMVRLYSRYLYLPYARRAAEAKNKAGVAADGGRHRILSEILGTFFRIDSLFSRLPWGIGWLLVAKKG